MCIDGMEEDLVWVDELAVRADGVIAATQRQINAIRLYSRTGTPIAVLGGRGEGPGEFRLPRRIGWMGDTLWVYDSNLRRVSLMLTDGTVLRTINTSGRAIVPFADEPRIRIGFSVESRLPDGTFLAWLTGGLGQRNSVLQEGSEAYARVAEGASSSAWRVTDIVARIPSNEWVEVRRDGGYKLVYPPFPNNAVLGFAPDGSSMAVLTGVMTGADAGGVRVLWLTTEGDTLGQQLIRLSPAPIPDEVADRVRARFEARAREAPTRAIAQAIRRAGSVPEIYPPVVDAILGADGRVWFRGRKPESGYRVVQPGTDRVRRINLPVRATVLAANATHIWTVELDRFDVPSIVRYALQP